MPSKEFNKVVLHDSTLVKATADLEKSKILKRINLSSASGLSLSVGEKSSVILQKKDLEKIQQILKEIFEPLVKAIQDDQNIKDILVDIIPNIIRNITDLKQIVKLNKEEIIYLIRFILNFIIDHINLTIKIWGFKIPQSVVKSVLKQIVEGILGSV